MKNEICAAIGIVGGAIASLLGGWDTALQTLIIFMAIDYITGLIVAGVFHTSPKTKTGTLESRAGWKGLCRKGVSLLVVLVACRLDAVIGSNFIRDTVVIAFVCNETISIVENAGLMEFPIVKDTTPNMMNPRLYTTSYNKPQGQQFDDTAVLSFIKLQYT